MTTPPPHNGGLVAEVRHLLEKLVEPLLRPINVVSEAWSNRLKHALRRKPKLFVRFHPQSTLWSLAFHGLNEGMHLIYRADFSHDDDEQALLLIDAYIKGAKPWIDSNSDPIKIPPKQLIRAEHIYGIFLHPIVAEPGKNWTGRIIFVDQWHRKYKTDKVEFVFHGPKEQPAKAKAAAPAPAPAP